MTDTTITQTPKYNISQDDSQLTLDIALPGVKKENISLSTEGFQIALKAKRSLAKKEEWSLISSNDAADEYILKLKINSEYDLGLTEAKFEKNVLRLLMPSKVANERTLEIQ